MSIGIVYIIIFVRFLDTIFYSDSSYVFAQTAFLISYLNLSSKTMPFKKTNIVNVHKLKKN